MFKRLVMLLSGLALAGCNQSSPVSPEKFTGLYATEMKKAAPHLSISVVAPLELKVKDQSGGERTAFLDNAYNSYRSAPADLNAVISEHVTAFTETRADPDSPVDKTRIVPVIKDRRYLTEIRGSLVARRQKAPDFLDLYEEYNAELWIFYAEDSPKNMRFLSQKDVAALKLDKITLRRLAIDNHSRLFGQQMPCVRNRRY